jgi:hypothetical protein
MNEAALLEAAQAVLTSGTQGALAFVRPSADSPGSPLGTLPASKVKALVRFLSPSVAFDLTGSHHRFECAMRCHVWVVPA